MDQISVMMRFLITLALGFVVGLQRESSVDPLHNNPLGGVRTFPVVALMGCLLAYLATAVGSWIPFAVGFAIVGAVVTGSMFLAAREGHSGITTSMALLTIYAIGGVCFSGSLILATTGAVALTMLLSMKVELHNFAHNLSQNDLLASLKFAVISAIILPLLPDHSYGPAAFQIFNPFKIWMMVVFISGIGFVGYVLVKLVGANRGIGLTGLLGGLASSTALTWNFTNRSKENPDLSVTLASGIVVAWTVMYLRVLAIVWVISSSLAHMLLIPMLVPVVPGLAWCFWLWKHEGNTHPQTAPKFSNPFELAPAIKFVLILLFVLIVSKGARIEFGDSGLLVSSFFAGLADVDSISISVGQMTISEVDFVHTAAIAVIIAGIANTLTKGCIAIFMGAPGMRRAIAPAMTMMIVAGLLTIALMVR